MAQPSSLKTTGATFLLIGFLILAIGYMVEYVQVGGMPESQTLPLHSSQLNLLFVEYVLVGFLSAVFIMFGIQFIRQKGGEKGDEKDLSPAAAKEASEQ